MLSQNTLKLAGQICSLELHMSFGACSFLRFVKLLVKVKNWEIKEMSIKGGVTID